MAQCFILTESGNVLTQEDGGALLLESCNTAIVPDLIGLTGAEPPTALFNANLTEGTINGVFNPLPAGTVIAQSIPAGTSVPINTPVSYTISLGPSNTPVLKSFQPFDPTRTVISQYSSSLTIRRMVEDMGQAIDPMVDLANFYNWCWNVDTAVGAGLDIWGKIVGVSRLLKIPGDLDTFGFVTSEVPYDWEPFNQGTFYKGNTNTQAYLLPDDTYRVLILTKALANIVSTTSQNLNKLLRNLFPGRGRCYVTDNGAMSMTFVFEFVITTPEYIILTQSGVLPHPAGVMYNVHVIPMATFFGFSEAGPTVLPFDFGILYSPPV